MKNQLVAVVIGVVIGIATCAVLGFSGSGASNGKAILIANEGGGAYFFNGNQVYFLSGAKATSCGVGASL